MKKLSLFILSILVIFVLYHNFANRYLYGVSCHSHSSHSLISKIFTNHIQKIYNIEAIKKIDVSVDDDTIVTLSENRNSVTCKADILIQDKVNRSNAVTISSMSYDVGISDNHSNTLLQLGRNLSISEINAIDNFVNLLPVSDTVVINGHIQPESNPEEYVLDEANQIEQRISVKLSESKFVTKYGSISVDKYQDILFNDKIIIYSDINKSYDDPTVEYVSKIDNDLVIIVNVVGIGGSGNSGRADYKLIDIKPDHQIVVKSIVNGWAGTNFIHQDHCIIAKTYELRLYADSKDYTLYTYCVDSGKDKYDNTSFAKTDEYYKNLFSNYSAKQIYNIAVAEHCVSNNNFVDDHVCEWGCKYCFMYSVAKHQDNNKYDDLLSKFCDADRTFIECKDAKRRCGSENGDNC